MSAQGPRRTREKERDPDKLYQDGARIRRALDKKAVQNQEELNLELAAKYKMKSERLNVDERYKAKVAKMQMQVSSLRVCP